MLPKNAPSSMFDRVLNMPLDATLRLDWSNKCVLLSKPSVFIVLPIIKPQFSIERFIVGSEFEKLEIFAEAVFIKNNYWNLKLLIVVLSSVLKNAKRMTRKTRAT